MQHANINAVVFAADTILQCAKKQRQTASQSVGANGYKAVHLGFMAHCSCWALGRRPCGECKAQLAGVVLPDHQSRCCNMTSGHKQASICSYKLSPDRKILLFFSFVLCRRRDLLKNFSVRTLLSVKEDHRRLPVVCDFQQGGEPIRKHPFLSCLVHHLADSAPQQSACLASHPGALCTSITFTQPDTILPG